MSRGKILVIRGGAIGDFILTLPALAALRQQFPQAHLEVLGYPHIAQLALAGGLVDRVQPIEARALALFFARDGTLAEPWRDYFSEFDIVISYLFDPDEIFQSNVRRCLHGQFIQGPHRPQETEGIHATRVFLKPLERLAIYEADAVPRLTLNSILSNGRADLPVGLDAPQRVPTIALHPGSGSERKNWPEAKWKELLRDLINQFRFHLLLVGGDAEGERLENFVKFMPKGRVQVARSLPLQELAVRLKPCAGFVGHDSGITHLAAAVGLPVLVLWADTKLEVWKPQGSNVVILRDETGTGSVPIGLVVEQISSLEVDKRFEPDRSRLFRWRFPSQPDESSPG